MAQLSFTLTIEYASGVEIYSRQILTLIEEFKSSLRDELLSQQDLSLICSHCPKQLPENNESVEYLCAECAEIGYSGNVDTIMQNDARKLYAELQQVENGR